MASNKMSHKMIDIRIHAADLRTVKRILTDKANAFRKSAANTEGPHQLSSSAMALVEADILDCIANSFEIALVEGKHNAERSAIETISLMRERTES